MIKYILSNKTKIALVATTVLFASTEDMWAMENDETIKYTMRKSGPKTTVRGGLAIGLFPFAGVAVGIELGHKGPSEEVTITSHTPKINPYDDDSPFSPKPFNPNSPNKPFGGVGNKLGSKNNENSTLSCSPRANCKKSILVQQSQQFLFTEKQELNEATINSLRDQCNSSNSFHLSSIQTNSQLTTEEDPELDEAIIISLQYNASEINLCKDDRLSSPKLSNSFLPNKPSSEEDDELKRALELSLQDQYNAPEINLCKDDRLSSPKLSNSFLPNEPSSEEDDELKRVLELSLREQ